MKCMMAATRRGDRYEGGTAMSYEGRAPARHGTRCGLYMGRWASLRLLSLEYQLVGTVVAARGSSTPSGSRGRAEPASGVEATLYVHRGSFRPHAFGQFVTRQFSFGVVYVPSITFYLCCVVCTRRPSPPQKLPPREPCVPHPARPLLALLPPDQPLSLEPRPL